MHIFQPIIRSLEVYNGQLQLQYNLGASRETSHGIRCVQDMYVSLTAVTCWPNRNEIFSAQEAGECCEDLQPFVQAARRWCFIARSIGVKTAERQHMSPDLHMGILNVQMKLLMKHIEALCVDPGRCFRTVSSCGRCVGRMPHL